jgi:hypothetical protein
MAAQQTKKARAIELQVQRARGLPLPIWGPRSWHPGELTH